MYGLILELKVMGAFFFSEKGQRNVEKGQNIEYWKIWAKMKKIWKYFEKGQVIADCMR